jgi:hypothetical protein
MPTRSASSAVIGVAVYLVAVAFSGQKTSAGALRPPFPFSAFSGFLTLIAISYIFGRPLL